MDAETGGMLAPWMIASNTRTPAGSPDTIASAWTQIVTPVIAPVVSSTGVWPSRSISLPASTAVAATARASAASTAPIWP
jgi:hypothetical protein